MIVKYITRTQKVVYNDFDLNDLNGSFYLNRNLSTDLKIWTSLHWIGVFVLAGKKTTKLKAIIGLHFAFRL